MHRRQGLDCTECGQHRLHEHAFKYTTVLTDVPLMPSTATPRRYWVDLLKTFYDSLPSTKMKLTLRMSHRYGQKEAKCPQLMGLKGIAAFNRLNSTGCSAPKDQSWTSLEPLHNQKCGKGNHGLHQKVTVNQIER